MSAQDEYNKRVVEASRQLIMIAGLSHLPLLDALYELQSRLSDVEPNAPIDERTGKLIK